MAPPKDLAIRRWSGLSILHRNSVERKVSDSILTLEEAASMLGYSPSGLRKIVNRTKSGKRGATIQFFQVGSGPIKFKREWIDDFIAANSVVPIQQRSPRELRHLRRAA